MDKHRYLIGIDTGVKTGWAVYDRMQGKLIHLETIKIHLAILRLYKYKEQGRDIKVFIEDARLRTWFGRNDKKNAQGVGSVKRDAKILDDFCKAAGIDYALIHPKNNRTKLDKPTFDRITHWGKESSEHSRDAAMLVFGK